MDLLYVLLPAGGIRPNNENFSSNYYCLPSTIAFVWFVGCHMYVGLPKHRYSAVFQNHHRYFGCDFYALPVSFCTKP